jgi:hypothetical protein
MNTSINLGIHPTIKLLVVSPSFKGILANMELSYQEIVPLINFSLAVGRQHSGFLFNRTPNTPYTAGMSQLSLDILKPVLLPDGDYVTIIFK